MVGVFTGVLLSGFGMVVVGIVVVEVTVGFGVTDHPPPPPPGPAAGGEYTGGTTTTPTLRVTVAGALFIVPSLVIKINESLPTPFLPT
mgnify:CR=1 FL=1